MKFSPDDLAFFHLQLASMVRVRTPLAEGLAVMARECTNAAFRQFLEDVQKGLEEGLKISDALARRPDVFSEEHLSLMRAGEVSGALDVSLEQIADRSRTTAMIERTLFATGVYPALTLGFSIAFLFFLWNGVFEKFKVAFQCLGVELPWLTAFLLEYGEALCFGLSAIGFLAIALFILIGSGFSALRFRKLDILLLHLPIMGPILRSACYSKFAMTLSHLLRHHIPLDQALDLTARSFESPAFRNALLGMKASVERGGSLADPMRDSGVFPESMTWKVALAEKRGDLAEALGHLHAHFSWHFSMLAGRVATLLSPILLLGISLMVISAVLGVFLPLYGMQMHLAG